VTHQINLTLDGVATGNELSELEIEAWHRLGEAERAVAVARQEVISVTNREGNKRRMRSRVRLLSAVDAAQAQWEDCP
jgi:hypothetical protein